MYNKEEIQYDALIAKQQTEIIRLQHEGNSLLRELVEIFRPRTLEEIKHEQPQLFNELLEAKLSQTSLGEVIQEYAKSKGMSEDEFINHSEHVSKKIMSELDESRRRTIEENRTREAKRAELLRQANEI